MELARNDAKVPLRDRGILLYRCGFWGDSLRGDQPMAEKREIIGHARHPHQGPHGAPPAGFTPLRLRIDALHTEVEIFSLEATVGRHSSANLRLGFPDVSRMHCQFVFEKNTWRVYDLHSLNGIYVNNIRTFEATLFAGDQVRLAAVVMLVLSGTMASDKLRQIADVLPTEF